MAESSEFGNLLSEALMQKNLDIEDFPDSPPKQVFISKVEIPVPVQEEITSAMKALQDMNRAMPFIHVTNGEIQLSDGSTSSTGFVENILKDGFKINTNVAGFVRRADGELARMAVPHYFIEHPEQFIEDVHLMLSRYRKHGTRVNKDILKGISHKTEGVPSAIIVDGTDLLVKRGVDGDDHYVTQERVRPNKVIGVLPINQFDASNKSDVMNYSLQILEQIRHYLTPEAMKQIA